MPAVTITPEDLAPFATIEQARAEAMITDALAMAAHIAPCTADDEFLHAAAAKAVIRGAILRWHQAGNGGVTQLQALGFSQTLDSRPQSSRGLFWPSEIEQLQQLCSDNSTPGIWSYDTVAMTSRHVSVCALNSGAQRCSCGSVLLA